MSRSEMNSTPLRWRFTLGFIVLQLFATAASLTLVFYLASGIAPDGAIPSIWLSEQIADSIEVGPNGKPILVPTEGLSATLQEWPSGWFVVELPGGEIIQQGEVPGAIAANFPFLRTFRSAELHGDVGNPKSVARLERMATAVGEVSIFAGGVSMSLHGVIVWLGNAAVAIPAAILAAITLIGVPWVTRWSLRSFNDLTGRLNTIDFEARGAVVDVHGLPGEVLRVVDGINKALRRLDNGFETTERFFVNAAHELRTPIAILQVRIGTLPPSEEKSHLQNGIKRLSAITNQLLDIEKYRQKPPRKTRVDLNAVVSKVVADLAPFAIAEGYEISFDSDAKHIFLIGDPDALERAFANLVRNAVQYGGKSGEICIGIETDGSVRVTDQGVGIASDKHARIFEPFYRINPHGSGAGLGLSMVHDIVTSHGGFIELKSSLGGGSTFAVRWREGSATSVPNGA
ncbi:HAMP domain-containing sensor histidine kinase [Mesorhizobium sp. Pch-S]|uniref:sensor histidine kinase n=1 Tax=Mesorhizobium sp. Pch-S TaxID=2082387 RepID=UPI001FDF8759|nr:HAMP domain-containing sensor histidine kinase [Mesorhizobium sp. Pch-S]